MSRLGLVNQARADRYCDGLRTVVGAELLEDALEMGLHGVRRDAEVARHLLGGGAVRALLGDLLFVASIPSMPGMRTSMKTTSGVSSTTRSTASSPLVASPTTTTTSSESSRAMRRPSRVTG